MDLISVLLFDILQTFTNESEIKRSAPVLYADMIYEDTAAEDEIIL